MSAEQVTQTIKEVLSLLLPVIPYLVKGVKVFGEGFVKSAGEKTGEQLPNALKGIWEKLQPKISQSPLATTAVEKVASNPQDSRAIGALELALEDILQDSSLLDALTVLLRQAREQGITVEQVTHLGKVYGEVINVDVEDASSLQNSEIRSGLKADEIKKGGKVTGVRIGKKNS